MKKKLKIIIQFLLFPFPSFIKIYMLRILGAKIGEGVKIPAFSLIVADEIELQPYSSLDIFVFIVGLCKVQLGVYSRVQRFSYISGNNYFSLNARSLIGSRCTINAGTGNIIIGEYSAIAPRSSLYTHGVFLPTTWGFYAKSGDIIIGDLVWIMHNCNISPKVTIGSRVLIFPGSTILKDVSNDIMLKDDGINRKEFKLDMVRKTITKEWLEAHIKEISLNLIRFELGAEILNSQYDDDNIQFRYKKDIISIAFKRPQNISLTNENVNYFFWYDFSENELLNNKYFCLDFYNLFYSVDTNKYDLLPIFASYFSLDYGLKFINYKYKEFTSLRPFILK